MPEIAMQGNEKKRLNQQRDGRDHRRQQNRKATIISTCPTDGDCPYREHENYNNTDNEVPGGVAVCA
jgi:hypothetical protein